MISPELSVINPGSSKIKVKGIKITEAIHRTFRMDTTVDSVGKYCIKTKEPA